MVFDSFLFFFKQKTAYELRISDWSSDVCSSDLPPSRRRARPRHRVALRVRVAGRRVADPRSVRRPGPAVHGLRLRPGAGAQPGLDPHHGRGRLRLRRPWLALDQPLRAERGGGARAYRPRSEEHTSELQSLMRIPYAVFCLIKKK